jgi:hypothetical protein
VADMVRGSRSNTLETLVLTCRKTRDIDSVGDAADDGVAVATELLPPPQMLRAPLADVRAELSRDRSNVESRAHPAVSPIERAEAVTTSRILLRIGDLHEVRFFAATAITCTAAGSQFGTTPTLTRSGRLNSQ